MELETGAERSKDGSCDFVIHLCALCILNPFQICASLLAAVKKLFLKKLIDHSLYPGFQEWIYSIGFFRCSRINLTYSAVESF